MPILELQHVISFTSEDPKNTVDGFIQGKCPWLCNSEEKSNSLTAEFQLQKASYIDYIDIGNFNTFTITIEVGRSSQPAHQKFSTLLPAMSLMSLIDCRTENNSKAVRMFKKGDFNQQIVKEKWDRIRVICCNPYRKKSQFGLKFMKVSSSSNISECQDVDYKEDKEKGKFFSRLESNLNCSNTKSLLSTPRIKHLYESDTAVKQSVTPKPLSRSAQMVMASKHVPNVADAQQSKTELEMEALEFMISLDLTPANIRSLKVSHIREQFEFKRNKALITSEKIIFKNIALDFAAQTLKRHDQKKENDINTIISSAVRVNENPYKFKTDKSVHNNKKNIMPSLNSSLCDNFDEEKKSPLRKKRNELALQDCQVTPSSSRKRIKKSTPDSSTPSTVGVWLTPGKKMTPKCVKSLPNNINNSSVSQKNDAIVSKNKCNFDLTLDSDSDEDVQELKAPHFKTDSSGHKLGQAPGSKFISNLPSMSTTNSGDSFVECPICSGMFPKDDVEQHAATCLNDVNSSETLPLPTTDETTPALDEKLEPCPICYALFGASSLSAHARRCAEIYFT